MTWGNRFRLFVGLLFVFLIVGAATLVLNQRESQVTSSAASVKAQTYTVGSDYAGTVITQSVKPGDTVHRGAPILSIQSVSLLRDMRGPDPLPQSAAYTVSDDGMFTLLATQPGIVSKMDAPIGGFVAAGQTLATIERSGSLYVLAEFRVDPTDFARIEKGARVDIVLPNFHRVSGNVSDIRVHSVKGQADASIEVNSSALASRTNDGLHEPGTPVTAILHLRDDGPFAGVKDAFLALLERIGL
jgi:multidrug resistance efflux pump